MNRAISIKGTREGLTITLGPGSIESLLDDLGRHLQQRGAFFRGGMVAVQAGSRDITEAELRSVGDLLQSHEMVLRTVVTSSRATAAVTEALGLRLVMTGQAAAPEPAAARKRPVQPVERAAPSTDGTRGMLVRRIVRSGQTIRHTGHVVVVGDVNPGGEVFAGGDIVVWGRLRGLAHAGCLGDSSAVVCALELTPQQLRIGKVVARPDETARADMQPETARVVADSIILEAWKRGRKGR